MSNNSLETSSGELGPDRKCPLASHTPINLEVEHSKPKCRGKQCYSLKATVHLEAKVGIRGIEVSTLKGSLVGFETLLSGAHLADFCYMDMLIFSKMAHQLELRVIEVAAVGIFG